MGRIFCSELLQENKNSFLQELKCELGNSFLSLLNGKLLLSHPKPLSTPKDSLLQSMLGLGQSGLLLTWLDADFAHLLCLVLATLGSSPINLQLEREPKDTA